MATLTVTVGAPGTLPLHIGAQAALASDAEFDPALTIVGPAFVDEDKRVVEVSLDPSQVTGSSSASFDMDAQGLEAYQALAAQLGLGVRDIELPDLPINLTSDKGPDVLGLIPSEPLTVRIYVSQPDEDGNVRYDLDTGLDAPVGVVVNNGTVVAVVLDDRVIDLTDVRGFIELATSLFASSPAEDEDDAEPEEETVPIQQEPGANETATKTTADVVGSPAASSLPIAYIAVGIIAALALAGGVLALRAKRQ